MFEKIGSIIGKTFSPLPPPQIRKNQLIPLKIDGKISGNFLFDISSIKNREHFFPFKSPSISIFRDNAISFSSTLSPSQFLKEIPEIETFDLTEYIKTIVPISDDFFQPLKCIPAHGKTYSAEQKEMFSPTPIQQSLSTGGNTGFRKSYSEQKTHSGSKARKTLTIWDLILPALQPPVDFEFSDTAYLPHSPFPYQVDGIKFLMENQSALLGDEMGTGKTVMSVVALKLLFQTGKIKKVLIVCPLSILSVWDSHLENWSPELEVTVVRGNQQTRSNDWKYPAHVYLTTFDTLRSDAIGSSSNSQKTSEALIDKANMESFDLLLIDEAQNIKNPASGRARAVKKFSPKYRWALTGTPIENRLDDLVALFSFIKPKYLQSNDLTPARAKEQITPYFKRRTKSEVMKDLPPKTKQENWLELDEDQEKEYFALESQGRRDIEEKQKREKSNYQLKMHIFALITKLKKVCNFSTGKLSSPKLRATKELVEEIADNGKKVLIFSQWKEEGIFKIAEELKKFGVALYHGGMRTPEREDAIKEFRKCSDKTVFLATVRSAGLGLTLTEASYVIHFDHMWNPAKMWQAEDRAHRYGQNEPVTIYSFWVKNTIEERIYNILEKKKLLHENVIEGLAEQDLDDSIKIEDWLEVIGIKKEEKETVNKEVNWRSSIQDVNKYLGEMDPLAFEKLNKELFKRLGYLNARVTQRTRDGGIDIIASKQDIGGHLMRIAVQCKRREMVGVEAARSLLGVLNDDSSLTKGYLVASGRISSEAERFCERNGRIDCIDGEKISTYLLNLKIDPRAI